MEKEENQNSENLNQGTAERTQVDTLDIKPMEDLGIKIESQESISNEVKMKSNPDQQTSQTEVDNNIKLENTVNNLNKALASKDQDISSLEEDGLIEIIKKENPKKEGFLNENTPRVPLNEHTEESVKSDLQKELDSSLKTSPINEIENLEKKQDELISIPPGVNLGDKGSSLEKATNKEILPIKKQRYSLEDDIELPKVNTDEKVIPTEEIKKENPIAIRTYRGDLAKVIKTDKISLTEAIIAEEKKKDINKKKIGNIKKINKTTRKKIYLSLLSLFLVISGVFFVISVYYYKPTPIIKVENIEVKSFIYSEYQREIFLDNLNVVKLTKLIQSNLESTNLPLGSLLHLYITKRYDENNLVGKSIVSTRELFYLINSRASETLLRFIEPDFMFGYYSSSQDYPFLILKTTSFDNIFPEMLTWEKNIIGDLRPLFVENRPSISEKGLRSGEFEFKDIIIKNKDTRAVLDDSGDIIFAYSFIDKNTIIITTSKASLQEIFDRLTISSRER